MDQHVVTFFGLVAVKADDLGYTSSRLARGHGQLNQVVLDFAAQNGVTLQSVTHAAAPVPDVVQGGFYHMAATVVYAGSATQFLYPPIGRANGNETVIEVPLWATPPRSWPSCATSGATRASATRWRWPRCSSSCGRGCTERHSPGLRTRRQTESSADEYSRPSFENVFCPER